MYYIVYGFLYALSLLPLRILYLLSDLAYFIVYYVLGYRKKVVLQNLSIVFPERSERERISIARKFYRNFTDTMIETIKLFSTGEKFLNRHMEGDYSLLHRLNDEGKKCQVHMGHNFNWEWANLAAKVNIRQKFLGVYMPLENKVFDRIFRGLRGKYGTVLLPATNMRESIEPHRNDVYLLGLVADQSPANPVAGFWINFFGRPTSFVKGPEKGARAGDMPVVFANITKKKRGYYRIHFTLGAEHPAQLQEGELTKNYVRFLEEVISAHPEMWLWSHRRWKLTWKPELGPVI